MILLCYVNCAEQSAETVSSPAIREEGTKGLLHHLRFWTVSWSVCAAATVFQTLIYKKRNFQQLQRNVSRFCRLEGAGIQGRPSCCCQLKVEEQGVRDGARERKARPGRGLLVHNLSTLPQHC